jgi:hypothetical protein
MVTDLDEDLQEMEYNEDGTEAKTSSEKHGEGPGTQQAGTSKASNIKGDLKAQEEDIAKEDVEVKASEDGEAVAEDGDTLTSDLESFFSEQEEEEVDDEKPLDVDAKMGEKNGEEKAEKDDDKDDKDEKDEKDEDEKEVDESLNLSADAENSVIEKLIDEMEELDEIETTYSKEGPAVKTGPTNMTYDKEGVKPGMEAPDEKKASGPEEDTKGAGTDQAGTGPAEGQIPPRKDEHDAMVKSKNYNEDADLFDIDDDELLEALASDEEGLEEKEWSGKDLPKKKEYHDESAPNGLGRIARGQPDMDKEEPYNEDYMKESFEIFKEAIKEDDDDDDDDKDKDSSDKSDDDDKIIA